MTVSRIPCLFAVLVASCSVAGCNSGDANSGDAPLLLFPPPPAAPRIQYLTWASGAGQVEDNVGWLDALVLEEGASAPAKTISKPYGVAARDGVVYVCDTKGYCLARMDFANRTFARLGTRGVGKLRKPLNIVIDPLGYKFVVDSHRKQVVVFDPQDEYAVAFDIPEPCHPVDLAIHGDEIFVLDNDDTPQVVVLDRKSGDVVRSFGSDGGEPGQFTKPSSLCVGSDGSIYVSDSFNYRIQKLTNAGEPVWQSGSPGRRLGEFGRPRGIRVGPDGVLFLVDGAMQLVQLFDSEGNILMRFGGPGNVPGGMVLPSTLAVDATSIPYFQDYIHEDFEAEYLLFVANQYGEHLINVYAFGSFPEGYQVQESAIAELPSMDESTGISPLNTDPESPGSGDAASDDAANPEHASPAGAGSDGAGSDGADSDGADSDGGT